MLKIIFLILKKNTGRIEENGKNEKISKFESIIKKYQYEHNNIKKLLDKFRENLKMSITSISNHENNYTGTLSSINPFIAKSQKIFETASRKYTPLVRQKLKKTVDQIPKNSNFSKYVFSSSKSNIPFAYEKQENISNKKEFQKSNITSIQYYTRSPNTPSVKERILYALTNEDENKKKIDYKIEYKIYTLNSNLVTLSINVVEQSPKNSLA